MTRVVVDGSRCTAVGICESLAPSYFEVDDEGDLAVLREDVTPDQRATVAAAVSGCPTSALALVED